jgi:hypothetical protein
MLLVGGSLLQAGDALALRTRAFVHAAASAVPVAGHDAAGMPP